MKDIRFHISLYITVPVIFSGFSALCILAAYRLTRFYLDKGLQPEWPLVFWGMFLVLIAFFCGLAVVKVLIDPVRKFVGKTRTLGMVRNVPPSQEIPDIGSDMYQYIHIFDQVSDLLTKVEARELFPDIIGQSEPMRMVLNQIVKVSVTDTTVLIIGETGTGKELIANCLHARSQRQEKPFVAINCAAIPSGLIESELFGHEKGAFTGADRRKPGKFETADGGTLFMDEVGDMPLEIQVKLLRALEQHQVERVGSVKPIKIDVRFIAATHQDLPQLVKNGLFRQDLFFRLNVFIIKLPPLRERREDIPLLADYFLTQCSKDKNQQLSSKSIQALMAYDWPGNVRELKHAVESAALMAEKTIKSVHLPSMITQAIRQKPRPSESTSMALDKAGDASGNLDTRIRELEKMMIIEALLKSKGVQNQAAKTLGIKERSLWHRLKKYNINAAEFKK
jgi:transcriptional regulator with GAF, ATPase, and Fis domain